MNLLPYQQRVKGCLLECVDRWEVVTSDVRVGLQVARSRRFPWLRIARVPRFGRGIPAARRDDVIGQLADVARRRNVLRLHLELWSEDHDELEALRTVCAAHGMVESRPRSYTHTILVDLTVGEEELLAGFHATCRRHIRAPEKKGYAVRRIVDVNLAPQIERMFRDAFDRTGGNAPRLDLPELISQAATESSDIHLVGLFASDDVSSRNPLAFATAILHGDVAEYAHAGSTRDPNVKVPLLYAPTWELMRWARARGAKQWDFGGVAGSDSGDAREGIDNFKFLFSNRVARVGAEWVLECSRLPSPLRPTG